MIRFLLAVALMLFWSVWFCYIMGVSPIDLAAAILAEGLHFLTIILE